MADNNDDFRKKREDYVVNIRRQKREEILNKKRNIQEQPSQFQYFSELELIDSKPITIIDSRYQEQIQAFINEEYEDLMFDQLASYIDSPDIIYQHRGLIGIRKILARHVDPPIKRFIDKGLTNKCIEFAKQKQFPQLKLQATWILTNVASGQSKFCDKLVERGGIELFIKLLVQNERGIVDQAIWGIGNLAADQTKYRDLILKRGGMQALIKVAENAKSRTLIRNSSWAITNLCRGQPLPEYQLIKNAAPLLCKVIKSNVFKTINSKQVLSDLIWAIAYMTQGSKARVEKVNQFQILPYIFQFVVDPFKQIHVPALKIIGNFSNGNENHTDQLIKNGVFNLAMKILDSPKKPMRRQMCWILSNITAGTANNVQAFMSRMDLIEKLSVIFHHDITQVKRQICWVFANIGHNGNRMKLIEICLHYDLIRVYTNLLDEQDSYTLQNVLQTVYKLFLIGRKNEINGKNVILQKFLEYGGGNKLQQLQMHENKKVYEGAAKILTKFFQLQQNQI